MIYRKNNSSRIFTFNEEIMNKKKFVQLDSIVLTIIYVRLIIKIFECKHLLTWKNKMFEGCKISL